MVSFLSRENPGTLPSISRPVKSRTLNRSLEPDFVRISISSSLHLWIFGSDHFTVGETSYVDGTETINYQNYLRYGKKQLIAPGSTVAGPAPNVPPRIRRSRGEQQAA